MDWCCLIPICSCRCSMCGIFTLQNWLILGVNVGKYSSTMVSKQKACCLKTTSRFRSLWNMWNPGWETFNGFVSGKIWSRKPQVLGVPADVPSKATRKRSHRPLLDSFRHARLHNLAWWNVANFPNEQQFKRQNEVLSLSQPLDFGFQNMIFEPQIWMAT